MEMRWCGIIGKRIKRNAGRGRVSSETETNWTFAKCSGKRKTSYERSIIAKSLDGMRRICEVGQNIFIYGNALKVYDIFYVKW